MKKKSIAKGASRFDLQFPRLMKNNMYEISQWFYQMTNQQWMPTRKQVQMTRFGLQSLLNLLPSIENELMKIDEAEGTELLNNPGKTLFKFESYLIIFFDY